MASTPTAPLADTLGDDDSSSDSSIPSDDDQFLESLKIELLSKKKFVVPAGFLAPLYRDCRPSAVEEQEEVVAPRREASDGSSFPCGVTNSPKRRRSQNQNDEWKNNSTCSDNSLQPNIAEEINGHALQKGRRCNNNPVNPESRERSKHIQSSSKFPSFSISMKPYHVTRHRGGGCYLALPREFCKRYLPDKDTTIILKDGNGVEYKTTHLSYGRRSSSYLCAGWAVFCQDHKLAVGDVLRFQLVNRTKFEVSIVKSNQSEKVAEDEDEDEDAIFEKRRRNLKKGRRCNNNPVNRESRERSKNIQSSSKFPSFSISMKPAHVTKHRGGGRSLNLPKKFCKRHLPDKNTTIILKDENGVEYETMYLSRTEHGSSNLSAGWAVFCDEHKLAVGDVLHFQLVNPTTFEVSVVKSNQSEKVAEDEDEDAIFEKPRRNLKKGNGRPRDVPSTPPVVCIDEITRRLEEAEAARHADKAIIKDLQKKYDSIMAAMQNISPRVQAPDTDVDSDETYQVTNQRKRRRCVKKVSTSTTSEDGSSCDHSPCSEDSSQLNISEIRLQKGRHCNNPLNPGRVEQTKNIPSSSEFPSFFMSMKPSYVLNNRKLRFPAEFSKHHLPDKDTSIILKGENGVEYKTAYLSRGSRGSFLTIGWREFSNDHKLTVGDVLRFQLVNQTKFKVFIVKSDRSDEVDGALFSKQSDSGAKKESVTSDRGEKLKMNLEAKLDKISKAMDWHNDEVKKLEKMRETVCHELKIANALW